MVNRRREGCPTGSAQVNLMHVFLPPSANWERRQGQMTLRHSPPRTGCFAWLWVGSGNEFHCTAVGALVLEALYVKGGSSERPLPHVRVRLWRVPRMLTTWLPTLGRAELAQYCSGRCKYGASLQAWCKLGQSLRAWCHPLDCSQDTSVSGKGRLS